MSDVGNKRRLLPVVGGAAGLMLLALVGAGAGWSIFQSSTPVTTQDVSSATVQVSLSGSGSSDSLTVGASDLVAGDTVAREVVLDNSGTGPIGSVTLSISGPSQANALTTDSTDGLQAEVQTCSGGSWSATQLADGGWSYSCSGTVDTIVDPEPVGSLASGASLPASTGSIAPGASVPLVVTLSLPTTAGNSLQGLSTTLSYTFVATQAVGGPA